jgi:hypothetical protein
MLQDLMGLEGSTLGKTALRCHRFCLVTEKGFGAGILTNPLLQFLDDSTQFDRRFYRGATR